MKRVKKEYTKARKFSQKKGFETEKAKDTSKYKEMKTTTKVPTRIHSANRKTLEVAWGYRRAREQKGTHPLMAFRAQTTCMKEILINKNSIK